MPGVVRQGDTNDKGGGVDYGVQSVLVNGRPIAANGSPVGRHRKNWYSRHSGVTASGNGSVTAEGRPVNTIGNRDSCGHTRSNGSSDVTVG
jgi:uncharacterized Zn-binding protein involved in type VI secretion